MATGQVFRVLVPKQGNIEQECEDSISVKITKEKDNRQLVRIAIADGATESSFAKEWANSLTKVFKKSRLPLDEFLFSKLPSLRKEWSISIQNVELPWYAQEKARSGAYSAFLGIIVDLEALNFEALAIGDCCFFQIRNEIVIRQFPLNSSIEFGNNPYLISSNENRNSELTNYVVNVKGELNKGDVLLLMSDALAHWFAKNIELGERPWNILLGFIGKTRFRKQKFNSWLSDQRFSKEVKNDDVVLAIIEI
ncbi:MAG: hypothetical protein WC185_02870 [Acholeplasmataceae bacterium]